MEKFGKFVVAHPDVIAVASALMTGFTVWRAYKYGTAVGAYRALVGGEQARAASEALGG